MQNFKYGLYFSSLNVLRNQRDFWDIEKLKRFSMKRSSRRWKKKRQMRWKWQRKRMKKEKRKRAKK